MGQPNDLARRTMSMRKMKVKETTKRSQDGSSDTRNLNQIKKEMALPRVASSLRNKALARRDR